MREGVPRIHHLRQACAGALIFAFLLAGSRSAHAQFTADFQTNLISGVTSNWSGDYLLAQSNSDCALIIQNGGVLGVNGSSFIGATYLSTNNFVMVTGAGSMWSNYDVITLSGGLPLYNGGPYNLLVITNGGAVHALDIYVGDYSYPNVGEDTVVVTGPGSLLTLDRYTAVGQGCPNNLLVVTNGGKVVSLYGVLGYGYGSGTAVITGPGSIWTNSSDMQVGAYGGGELLLIQNGGQVANANGYVGLASGNNAVWVSDPGSVWTNSGGLYVGNASTANLLVVTNSGSVYASNLVVGSKGQGSLVLNGGTVNVLSLIATNGTNSGLELDAGTLITQSTVISNGPVFVLGDGAQTVSFQMTGPGNTFRNNLWLRSNSTLEGCATVNGSMLIEGRLLADCGGTSLLMGGVTNNGVIDLENGSVLDLYGPTVNNGVIYATNGIVRDYASLANSGTILGNVQDMHDIWTNPADGRWEVSSNWSQQAPASLLWPVITNAASKTVLLDDTTAATHPETLTINGLTLGAPAGATNTLLISNSGATPLQVLYDAVVGGGGSLSLDNAAVTLGALSTNSLSIDGQVSANASALTVTNGTIEIGITTSGQMSVSNTVVSSADVVLGNTAGAPGLLMITGSNSLWNGTALYVGQTGQGSGFALTGGRMNTTNGTLGYASGSGNNTAQVAGAGSTWSNRNNLILGLSGAGNQLLINNGGLVISSNAIIGSNVTAFANSLFVTDPGSTFSNLTGLVIGGSGGSSSLIVSNGASVLSGSWRFPSTNFIGYASGSNLAVIDGPGTVWRSFVSSLNIGHGGSGNNLIITNGGLLSDSEGTIGTSAGAMSNSVLVTGTGSTWSNFISLSIGVSGGGNSLMVRNGGAVVSGRGGGTIGANTNGVGNSVLIADAGSSWNAGPYNLYVGNGGAANSLVISNNASVTNSVTYIGYNSSNNAVTVSAGGALQNGILLVGYSGSSNSLVISGGNVNVTTPYGSPFGTANDDSLMVIGYNPGSSNNLVELDSGSLIVTNSFHTGVLEVRRGKLVINGGLLQADELLITNSPGLLVRNGGVVKIGKLVIASGLSSVGDGVPDAWRALYFQGDGASTNSQSCATCDPDGDGMPNFGEYLCGTDPTDNASFLHMKSVAVAGTNVQVTWTTVGGKSYVVQTNAVDFSGFGDLSPRISARGIGESVTNYTDVGGATNRASRFYRVRLGP